MNKSAFLDALEQALKGMPQLEINEVIVDYAAHFADGAAAGRSEEDIAAALGDPTRLARELRAEAGVRRWEENRTPINFVAALFGLLALITVNFVFLLPVLGVIILFTFSAGLVVMILCIIGLVILADLNSEFLFGFAFLGFGVGGGALLIMMVDGIISLLARYARLHYAVLNQGNPAHDAPERSTAHA